MNQTPPPDPQKTGRAPTESDAPKTPAGGAQNLAPEQMARFVTTIKNADQQVGEHVIRALQHGDTVAVLTTVVIGPGGQQNIVSAALNAEKTAQVNALLQNAAERHEQEEPCVGFHCLIKPKNANQAQGE